MKSIQEKTLRERQKDEAVKRMACMNLLPNIPYDFYLKDKLYVSDEYGIIFTIEEEEKRIVEEFEKKYNYVVYHLSISSTPFGRLLNIFYISDNEDEWEMELEDISEGHQNCYVKNYDIEKYSEFGIVYFNSWTGGITRTA